MKKLIVGLLVTLSVLSFDSCTPYDSYYGDYLYTTSYFAHPKMDRSVIINEYDSIQVGAVLGGKIKNEKDEWVKYQLVNDLVTKAGYVVLPQSLYEFKNNNFEGLTNVITIPKGQVLGMMTIKLKPAFFSDPLALSGSYALAFTIVGASTDSIGNKETLVTFKYVSNAVGFYTHRGRAISLVDTLRCAKDEIELKTMGPAGSNSLLSPKTSVGPYSLVYNLTVDSQNNVIVKTGTGSAFPLTSTSPGFFDAGKNHSHNIVLKYSFQAAGKTYNAQDTLVFVKRVIDNVIQWDTRFF
jgi:hypothetical protein